MELVAVSSVIVCISKFREYDACCGVLFSVLFCIILCTCIIQVYKHLIFQVNVLTYLRVCEES